MARPKKQTIEKETSVIVTLDTAGLKYTGKGETIHDALKNLPLTYLDVKAKGVITVVSGDKRCERLFYLQPLKALIANKLRKIGYAKQLEALLK